MRFTTANRLILFLTLLIASWNSTLSAEPVVQRVEFQSDDGQAKLVGTLSFRRSAEPLPAVVLISSVGPPKLRHHVLNRPSLQSLEQDLVRRGAAVLWFDDRGTGESTGDSATSTIKQLARDVRASVAFLKRHPGIDTKRIGLIGHSDGGLSAPMVAAESDDVAFVILISPAGSTGHAMVMRQLMRNARSAGVSGENLEAVRTFASRVLRKVQRTPAGEVANLQAVRPASFIASAGAAEIKWARETVALFQVLDSAWIRHFLSLDAAALLRQVACPMLIVYGGDDDHFPGDANTMAAKEAIASNEYAEQSVVELPGLNHNLQRATATDGKEDDSNSSMDPAGIRVIQDWVSARVRNVAQRHFRDGAP